MVALRALLAYAVGAIQLEHLGPLSGSGTDAMAGLSPAEGPAGAAPEVYPSDAAPCARRPAGHRPANAAQLGVTGSRRSGMPASAGVRSPLRWLQA
ncbi:hypothetical protein M2302_004710 [Micromonospora sp. A200]|nr:hypothetical protein [Micromonospora sp. A200]